ncbi:hypothetical protein PV379_00355 [Streptomyces caniscabiei]|uniref:hypothetical protein n=1 Tax=Streptomyces caniscabiei TaxID=2746961 RepID=UPI0029B02338|nr:hypothetical protein [Streptomyces caniscabiei]MDX2775808.1 hypothetical protein [Streptomyces caniscabiei]
MEFAKTTPAPTPKTKNIRGISILTAVFFVLLAVSQLFTFERFADVLQLQYAGLGVAAPVLAACIVTLEVAALPFLLAMPLSAAARVLSMAAAWGVVLIWCVLSMATLIEGSDGTALLGATLDVPGGWWTVCFTFGLGVLVAWATWGMWPLSARRRMSK